MTRRLGVTVGVLALVVGACSGDGDGGDRGSAVGAAPVPTTTTTASTVPPTTTTTVPPPPASSWPTAETTGVTDPAALTPWTGDCTFRTDGELVENKVFDCGPDIYANGVTIRNSIVRGNEHWGINVRPEDGAPAIVENVTFEGGTACNFGVALGAGNYHASKVKVLNFGDAFRYSTNNTVVRDSYAKLCAPGDSGAHSDGLQGYLAPDATADRPHVFEHNTVDQRCSAWEGQGVIEANGTGNPADRACSVTANVFWSDESGNGLVVKDNLFRGGGFTIRVHAGSGHTVSGNVVERDSWAFGPVTSSCGAITWTGNRLADVSEAGVASNPEPLECSE